MRDKSRGFWRGRFGHLATLRTLYQDWRQQGRFGHERIMAKSACTNYVLAPSHPAPRKGFTAKPISFCQTAGQQSLASQFCLILVKLNAVGVHNYR
jgi:hypothetical protein